MLGLTVFCTHGLAQDKVTPDAPEPAAEIDIPSPRDAGDTLRDIERLVASIGDMQRVQALRERLATAEKQLAAELDGRLLGTPLDRIDRNQLGGVQMVLARQRSLLLELRRDVGDAIAETDATQKSLRRIAETWSTVLSIAEQQEQPPELIELVKRVLANADAARQRVADYLGALVTVETDALALNERIESLIADTEARQQTLMTDLFARDANALWDIDADLSIGGMLDDLATIAEAIRYGLRDLIASYGGRLPGQAVFGAVVLFLLLRARRSRAFAVPDGERSAAERALEHPVAMAAILTLALTQALYPTAQPSIIVLNATLFLAAELVILSAVQQVISWTALASVGIFLIALRAAYLLPFASPLHRLVILLGAAIGMLLLLAAWRITNRTPVLARWRAALNGLLLALGLALSVVMLADLLGAVALASFLVEAIVRSMLAALGLLTLSIVIPDFIEVLLDTGLMRPLRSIQRNRSFIARRTKKATNALALILWFATALVAFGLFDAVLGAVIALLNAEWVVGQVSLSLGTALVFILSVWLAVYLSRLIRFFLDADVLPRFHLPRGVPAAVSTGVHYLIIAAALLFGTAAAGIDLTKFAIVVGALSVGIGFGLQNIVNNFISGLILLLERPVQAGDQVQVGPVMGRISRIGIRSSTIRLYEGSEVIVPNGDLISQQVTNYTLSDRNRRLEVIVGVAYGTDLDRARDVIMAAAASCEHVTDEPPVQALFLQFGESSIDFRVLFWVDDFDVSLLATSEVGLAIDKALKREGIQIPFPQRDVHLFGPVQQPTDKGDGPA